MRKIGLGPGRILFNVMNGVILALLSIITLYPFLYVLSASLSSADFIMKGSVSVIPDSISLLSYKQVANYPLIWNSYKNTILYTVVGTGVNLILTAFGAYPLSRKRFIGRNFFMKFIVFTMLFSGGMIPTFLVVKGLGLYNTFWALIFPGAISAYNLIILRTFYEQIPIELEESATIDGCNDMQILLRIILPLSIPACMTIGLFYAVGHWNAFFSAFIYLMNRKLFPLQIILRDIVINGQMNEFDGEIATTPEGLKYATIMVATLPILCVYPFIQKHFVKGVMIGAVKG